MAAKKQELIYVVQGEDESLVNDQCRQLIEEILQPQERMTCLLDTDGDKAQLSEVLDELRTLPFLARKRVVLIRKADDFISANRELLEEYFGIASATGVLILAVKSWPGNTRLAKKLPDVGKVMAISQPYPEKLPAYVTDYAREEYGKAMERGAAELLVELLGGDVTSLRNEAEKLAVYVGDAKAITAKDVESLTGQNRLFNAFEVIDACLAGQAGRAVQRLRKMFAEEKDAEYTAVGAFAYHFRRLFNAKKMLEAGSSEYEVGQALRIWQGKEAIFKVLRSITLKRVGEYIQRLAEIDYQIKTGQTTAAVAIERLVLKMCA